MKLNTDSRWDLASLVDLEVSVAQEKNLDDSQLKRRDRAFYKRYNDGHKTDGSRSRFFRAWVEERSREKEQDIPTPGQEAEACLGWIKRLGSLATFLIGATWAWGALSIHGVHGAPVNVLTFWLLTIGIPFLLTLVGFYLLFGRKLPHVAHAPFFFKTLIAKLLVGSIQRTQRHITESVGNERELAIRVQAGELRARFSDRHGLFASLLANTFHILGLGMVLGIFTALFAFKIFSNQDYGWQSDAACVTAERVEKFVGIISWPWTSICGEGVGHPTTQEIASTRFLRNEGVKGMDHSASINWSSFLVLSSLFWGVLPRVALFVMGRVSTRRQLAKEDFSQHRFDALWRRMAKPDIIMEPVDAVVPENSPMQVLAPANLNMKDTRILLLPQDIAGDQLKKNVIHGCETQYGFSLHENRVMPALPTARALLLDDLASLPEANQMDLHILQESVMPPQMEFLSFLKDCRAKLGREASIRIVLIGESDVAGTWDFSSELNISVWNDKIAILGDPRISILILDPTSIN